MVSPLTPAGNDGVGEAPGNPGQKKRVQLIQLMSPQDEPSLEDFYHMLEELRGHTMISRAPEGLIERIVKLLPERRQGYLRRFF